MSGLAGAHVLRRPRQEGGSTWQVRWREQGRQMAKSFPSRHAADQFVREVGVVKSARSVMAASLLQPGRLSELLPNYVEIVRAKSKPGSMHAEQVRTMLTLSFRRMNVTWTNEVDSSAFDRLVRTHGDHRSTLKKAISLTKTFLRWARRSRLLIDEWAFDYQAPRHIPDERISWNEDQLRRLFTEVDKPNAADALPRGEGNGRGSPQIIARMRASKDHHVRAALRPILFFLIRWAPRPIEASRLSVADWDPSTRTISFPGKITKNGRPRSFVVDRSAAAVLTTAAGERSGREPLFLTYKGNAWKSHHLTDVINDLIDRAKLPGTAYSARHTACTRLVRLARGDLALVQSISGHRTLSELQRYLHATQDGRDAIANAFDAGGDTSGASAPSYLRVAQ